MFIVNLDHISKSLHLSNEKIHAQPVITYSKLSIETLEQGVKYIQIQQFSDVVLVSLLLTLKIFHLLF